MVEKLILPFPLLSDSDGEVSRRYGVWDEPDSIAVPAIFVIDPRGRLRWSYVGQDFADRPGDDELLAAVAQASA